MELGQVARKRNTRWMTCAIFTESHQERCLIQIIRRDINVVDIGGGPKLQPQNRGWLTYDKETQ
jgi:hypothetical protein